MNTHKIILAWLTSASIACLMFLTLLPTVQTSKHQRRVEESRLPKDGPNILIVLIDGVGFAQTDSLQYEPRLYENLNTVEPPHDQKYHLTEDMAGEEPQRLAKMKKLFLAEAEANKALRGDVAGRARER